MQSTYNQTPPVRVHLGPIYQQERTTLANDPLTAQLAAELANAIQHGQIDLVDNEWITPNNQGGAPTLKMMLSCNRRYASYGGTNSKSIGGVAHAVWQMLLPNLPDPTA